MNAKVSINFSAKARNSNEALSPDFFQVSTVTDLRSWLWPRILDL